MLQEYLEVEDDSIEDGVSGREALEEAQAEDGEAFEGERSPKQGPRNGPGEREGGDDRPGDTEGGSARPGVGDGNDETDLSPERGGAGDTAAGSDAV